jgi:ParB family transcriptional regulator, chromosome partitioning protein
MARRSLEMLRESLAQVEAQPSSASSIALTSIRLPAQQPRRYFDPEKLQQLAQSIQEHGILEPLLVRPLPDEPHCYELVAGERRYRAAQQLGLQEVPVVVRELSDSEALQLALIENLQREDLNPVEETEGILQLLAMRLELDIVDLPPFLHRLQHEQRKASNNVVGTPELETVEGVFVILGSISWQSFVNHRLPLLNLPEEILEALRQGRIAYTKAQVISRVKDASSRQGLLEATIRENLSIREIRERIKALQPGPEGQSPKGSIETLSRKVIQARLWEDPKKWKQAQALLAKLEALVTKD